MTEQQAQTSPGGFVDVHTHLIHPKFEGEEDAAAQRAAAAGVEMVIVNGLEPVSNRRTLELCAKHPNLQPALGIYPVDACCNFIDPQTWPHPFDSPARFDVDAEVDFIESVADQIIAVGECGLDGYWIKDGAALGEQERVLRRLCEVAIKHDLPVILHTRKAERRTFEIIVEMGVKKADFHCWGGKSKLAVKIAQQGYSFSIPPVVERSQAFQSLARKLPLECILTETDAPYMGPDQGQRNEPAYIPRGVAAIAKARGEDPAAVAVAIRDNFKRLFGC